jgi:hypothetical protein
MVDEIIGDGPLAAILDSLVHAPVTDRELAIPPRRRLFPSRIIYPSSHRRLPYIIEQTVQEAGPTG